MKHIIRISYTYYVVTIPLLRTYTIKQLNIIEIMRIYSAVDHAKYANHVNQEKYPP